MLLDPWFVEVLRLYSHLDSGCLITRCTQNVLLSYGNHMAGITVSVCLFHLYIGHGIIMVNKFPHGKLHKEMKD